MFAEGGRGGGGGSGERSVVFGGGGAIKIGATFLSFFSPPYNKEKHTNIDEHSKTLVHTTSAHIESVFTALAHTENRHTSLQHSNQSQILSYIRLDNRKFLSATSMLSL